MSGIYLHIPFCKQACSYCDFYFVTRASQQEQFVDRLVGEIHDYKGSIYTDESVQTIYFGGGTPSLLDPAQIERILKALRDTFSLELQEVTLEMNPDDVRKEYLNALKSTGVTRASMGVQTFDAELLKFMNRAHSREEALHCLELLSQSGFEAYTVDLIYGNPGQSLEMLEADLEQLLVFNPPHISAYSLTVESGTRLGKQVSLGRIVAPEDDIVADHFDLVGERLTAQDIYRYEVSNYSKTGHEAVHNSNYWHHHSYIGLGPGAHSFWWGDKAMRWINKPDLRSYLMGDTDQIKDEIEELTLEELVEERIMMGLRTREGVSIGELEQVYNYRLTERQRGYLQDKMQEGKLTFEDRIILGADGIRVADAIIFDLITLH